MDVTIGEALDAAQETLLRLAENFTPKACIIFCDLCPEAAGFLPLRVVSLAPSVTFRRPRPLLKLSKSLSRVCCRSGGDNNRSGRV